MKKKQKQIKGKVYLVGAGPGAVELLTVKAARLIQEADVIVYDALINPSILELACAAKKIYVGKKIDAQKKRLYTPQEKINTLLVQLAKKGEQVVRLKGGDPFVFGRGGEEASYLKSKGVLFEVVPGVSSGVAGPAYAGIPVTDRRKASVVTFVAAHGKSLNAHTGVDWKVLSKLKGTLILFMGVTYLEKTISTLVKYGKSKKTLVTIIQSATLPNQKVLSGRLENIVRKAKQAKIKSPALIVIGEVNKFQKQLSWVTDGPLAQKKILVTRAQPQMGTLKKALEEVGAHVLEYPVIQIKPPTSWRPLDQALENIRSYDWILFTSVNGVNAVMERLRKMKKDARIFFGVKIGAIGQATEELLKEHGIYADLVPKAYTSKSLVSALNKKRQIKGKSFLLPRTDIAPPYLREEIIRLGGKPKQVIAYKTLAPKNSHQKDEIVESLSREEIDYVTFTSSSTVTNFFRGISAGTKKKLKKRCVSIGPITTQTLRSYGIQPCLEARSHTIKGVVDAISSNI